MTVDGNTINVSMAFAKVNKEERLVSGYATLDNIDTQGDIVLAEASAKAFARARGNIREMHQPLAVGRMVDFREDEFYDTDSGKFYRGIFVTARVSEGAEDTWKKVLDGTLTGFSIGGEINEASNEFVKDAGRSVRFIKDYDLVELSLVDNPANQLANVLSIQKSASGSVTVKGMAVETKIENVFVCVKHDQEIVIVKDIESADCPDCGLKMENAGWFESGNDRTEKVAGIVEKFLSPADKEAAPISNEGGVEQMGVKKNEAPAETPVPEGKTVSSPNPAEAQAAGDTEAVATVEEEAAAVDVDETEGTEEVKPGEEPAESPDEVTDEETQISKKIDELHDAVKTSLEESKEETLKKVSDLEGKIKDATDEFLKKASELEKKIDKFGENVETQKQRLSDLENSLEKMNRSEAFRKSADVQPAEKIVQKDSFWGNAFSD